MPIQKYKQKLQITPFYISEEEKIAEVIFQLHKVKQKLRQLQTKNQNIIGLGYIISPFVMRGF
jgi:hypothetical protein